MGTRSALAILGIAAVAVLPSAVVAQAPDPAVGTWELNLTKSTFSPGPAPKSETRTYAMAGKKLKMTSIVVDAAGTKRTARSTYTVDGRVYPVTGEQGVDSQSLTQIDRYNVEGNIMYKGKVVQTAKRTVSNDGKVLTIWFKGSDAKGQKIDNMLVFDKR
jgi:hypothetical protein